MISSPELPITSSIPEEAVPGFLVMLSIVSLLEAGFWVYVLNKELINSYVKSITIRQPKT